MKAGRLTNVWYLRVILSLGFLLGAKSLSVKLHQTEFVSRKKEKRENWLKESKMRHIRLHSDKTEPRFLELSN